MLRHRGSSTVCNYVDVIDHFDEGSLSTVVTMETGSELIWCMKWTPGTKGLVLLVGWTTSINWIHPQTERLNPSNPCFQVHYIRGQEEAGHPAGQRGSAPEAQRPDPAGRRHAQRHRSLPRHRPAAETGSTGLVSCCFSFSHSVKRALHQLGFRLWK